MAIDKKNNLKTKITCLGHFGRSVCSGDRERRQPQHSFLCFNWIRPQHLFPHTRNENKNPLIIQVKESPEQKKKHQNVCV